MAVLRLTKLTNQIQELEQKNQELEQQTQELEQKINPQNVALSSASVNWSLGDTFYFNITSNQSFTFANVLAAKTITLIVRNDSASQRTITFPVGSYKEEYFSGKIDALTENVYTLVSSNNKVYIAEIRGLTNA